MFEAKEERDRARLFPDKALVGLIRGISPPLPRTADLRFAHRSVRTTWMLGLDQLGMRTTSPLHGNGPVPGKMLQLET
jgi:hypothetical protein